MVKLRLLIFFAPIVVLFFIAQQAFSQNIKNYIRQNAVQIKSIDPDSTNYIDLEAIGMAIGDSKIVMLGEQDHGDAPTFLAKSRLIKYLHEKKGFDVLAFESDFFSLNEGWDRLKKTKKGIDSFLLGNVFPIWTLCPECQNLFFDYIPATYQSSAPLIISGIDPQMLLSYSGNLSFQLDSLIRSMKLPIASATQYHKLFEFIGVITYNANTLLDSAYFKKGNLLLDTLKMQLCEKLRKGDFWLMVVDNLIEEGQYSIAYNEWRKNNGYYWKMTNARDKQMALNLEWLAEYKYPGKKIIVWAHNGHISKSQGHWKGRRRFMNAWFSMGSVLAQDTALKKKMYVMGFTSNKGMAGRIVNQKIYSLPRPKSQSFENWISKSYPYAFVNFNNYNIANWNNIESFYMSGSISGNGLHSQDKMEWSKIFDGVFYIRDMYPCKAKRPVF